METFGDRLKRIRIEKHFSQSELSKLSGVGNVYISNLERNIKSKPSIEIAKKLADALKTPVDELLNDNDSVSRIKEAINQATLNTIDKNNDTALASATIINFLLENSYIDNKGNISEVAWKILEESLKLDAMMFYSKKGV